MHDRYVILQSEPRTAQVRGVDGIGGRQATAPIKVLSASLNASEAEDIRRAPETEAMARSMPMRLVAPLAATTAAAPPRGGACWGIEAVGAGTQVPVDCRSVTVAVLDTGIDAAHQAFRALNLVGAGPDRIRDFTGEGGADSDSDGHGTHCSASIFGQDVDGVRIGVAPGVRRVLIGKVLGVRRSCTSEQICQAVMWAADSGAHIISMSLGLDFPGHSEWLQQHAGMPPAIATSRALEDYRRNVTLFGSLAALLAAHERSPLLVAAAGNESLCDQDPNYTIAVAPPAVAGGFVSVAAMGMVSNGWRIADFSNRGASICAPGVDIWSAGRGNGLSCMSGTSMAAPYVAGVAALWHQWHSDSNESVGADSLRLDLMGRAVVHGFDPACAAHARGRGLVQAPPGR